MEDSIHAFPCDSREAQQFAGMTLRDYLFAKMLPVTYQARVSDLHAVMKTALQIAVKFDAGGVNEGDAFDWAAKATQEIAEHENYKELAESVAVRAVEDAYRVVDAALKARTP